MCILSDGVAAVWCARSAEGPGHTPGATVAEIDYRRQGAPPAPPPPSRWCGYGRGQRLRATITAPRRVVGRIVGRRAGSACRARVPPGDRRPELPEVVVRSADTHGEQARTSSDERLRLLGPRPGRRPGDVRSVPAHLRTVPGEHAA